MGFVCRQCPRNCGVLRGDEAPGEGPGFCRMGQDAVLARAALHFDEEPCISGTTGSGAVFFSGCALRCVFCQNDAISRGCFGVTVSRSALRACFERLIAQGAWNINLVNPTHFSLLLREVLEEPLPVPVVWNSGGYEKVETLRALEGRVQVYLPDLKYVDEAPARRYSQAPDYFSVAAAALREMVRQQGEVVLDEQGRMVRGVLVRHLILPGHSEDSIRALEWIARELPGVWVSLMAQYLPCADAGRYPPLDRRVTREEYDRVLDAMWELGIENGYVQDLEASDEKYIPAFDLTGVLP